MRLLVEIVALLFLCYAVSAQNNLTPKQLAGPPSEFPIHAIPDPLFGAIIEDSVLLSTNLFHNGTYATKRLVSLFVDSQISFSFVVYVHPATIYSLRLYDPHGREVHHLSKYGTSGTLQFGSDTLNSTTYTLYFPKKGEYLLKLYFQPNKDKLAQFNKLNRTLLNLDDALIVLQNDSPIKIFSHLNTYQSLEGSNIGLVTQLYEETKENLEIIKNLSKDNLKRPSAFTSLQQVNATLSVVLPDGEVENVPMYDDGLHDDLAANDGVYGGSIEAPTAGVYLTRAKFNVSLDDGTVILRSTQHIISVVDGQLSIVGDALAVLPSQGDQIPISISVSTNSVPSASTFRVYAQVWGSDKQSGELVPVCWISSLSPLIKMNGSYSVSAELNSQWIAAANAVAPFYLKTVTIQNIDNYIVYTTSPSILLIFENSTTTQQNFFSSLKLKSKEITEEMREGRRPEWLKNLASAPKGSTGKLLLVHGYCSPENPWSAYSKDFTDAYYFLNADSNVSNDEFAKLIAAYANNQQITSYSAVGYSQGGMAVTHLKAFYWSGLDGPSQPTKRTLQSVATPYQGSSAAGSAATIGKSFGIGCGAITDLTTDGAKLWSSLIPATTREELYYYYVTYTSKIFASYCNAAINLLLKKPNDGVVEEVYTSLPGAHLVGSKSGWCHGADMKYPPAFSDSKRNQEINANAAR